MPVDIPITAAVLGGQQAVSDLDRLAGGTKRAAAATEQQARALKKRNEEIRKGVAVGSAIGGGGRLGSVIGGLTGGMGGTVMAASAAMAGLSLGITAFVSSVERASKRISQHVGDAMTREAAVREANKAADTTAISAATAASDPLRRLAAAGRSDDDISRIGKRFGSRGLEAAAKLSDAGADPRALKVAERVADLGYSFDKAVEVLVDAGKSFRYNDKPGEMQARRTEEAAAIISVLRQAITSPSDVLAQQQNLDNSDTVGRLKQLEYLAKQTDAAALARFRTSPTITDGAAERLFALTNPTEAGQKAAGQPLQLAAEALDRIAKKQEKEMAVIQKWWERMSGAFGSTFGNGPGSAEAQAAEARRRAGVPVPVGATE